MHELSLCQNIIEIVIESAEQQPGKRIKKIELEVGQLTGVKPEEMQLSFQVASRGTLAEHAILELIEVKGKAFCVACQKEIEIAHYYDPCPDCGHCSLHITQGEGMQVKSMDLE